MLNDVFSYCSWLENDIASNIYDFVNENIYYSVPRWKVDNFLKQNHIDYFELPQYLKDEIDRLDVI